MSRAQRRGKTRPVELAHHLPRPRCGFKMNAEIFVPPALERGHFLRRKIHGQRVASFEWSGVGGSAFVRHRRSGSGGRFVGERVAGKQQFAESHLASLDEKARRRHDFGKANIQLRLLHSPAVDCHFVVGEIEDEFDSSTFRHRQRGDVVPASIGEFARRGVIHQPEQFPALVMHAGKQQPRLRCIALRGHFHRKPVAFQPHAFLRFEFGDLFPGSDSSGAGVGVHFPISVVLYPSECRAEQIRRRAESGFRVFQKTPPFGCRSVRRHDGDEEQKEQRDAVFHVKCDVYRCEVAHETQIHFLSF